MVADAVTRSELEVVELEVRFTGSPSRSSRTCNLPTQSEQEEQDHQYQVMWRTPADQLYLAVAFTIVGLSRVGEEALVAVPLAAPDWEEKVTSQEEEVRDTVDQRREDQ